LSSTRAPDAFATSHIPGAISLGLAPSFGASAEVALPPDARLIVVASDESDYVEAVTRLRRRGYADPLGYLEGGVQAWMAAGLAFESLAYVAANLLQRTLTCSSHLRVLDVRGPAEWRTGHIDGAVSIPMVELPERLDDVPPGPIATVCDNGYRSMTAASLLRRAGRLDPILVAEGMRAWRAEDRAIVRTPDPGPDLSAVVAAGPVARRGDR
jgi:hydroxyacylglutathione hydrolase